MPLRNLEQTQQEWCMEPDNAKIYNTPIETGSTLDSAQGKVSVRVNSHTTQPFWGTCGLVSCVNVLRMAGRTETTEKEVLQVALQHKLCRVHPDPGCCGGTTSKDRKDVLAHFGLDSWTLAPSVEAIALFVSQGRGVIITVDPGELWQEPEYLNSYHAITVTSVKTDLEGNILGFYICDSGRRMATDSARYCEADFLEAALCPVRMNVTASIIR